MSRRQPGSGEEKCVPASSIVPPGCSTDAGSDGAARLSRVGEDALLPWDACSGFNAINECQWSKGPWLGAGSRRVPRAPCGGWLCSRVCMSYSARKREARGKGCLLCHGRRCSPSTQIFNFGVYSYCQSRAGFASVGGPKGVWCWG